MILAHLSHFDTTAPAALGMFFQEPAVGFDPMSLWKNMGILAKAVAVILFIMSIWSLAVMIDRAHPVAPVPVLMITPDDDCRSLLSPSEIR